MPIRLTVEDAEGSEGEIVVSHIWLPSRNIANCLTLKIAHVPPPFRRRPESSLRTLLAGVNPIFMIGGVGGNRHERLVRK